jgi:uncharacterized protein (UPF0261 family)
MIPIIPKTIALIGTARALQGVSAIDKPGGPFYSPEALNSYRRAVKTALSFDIKLVELDAHINLTCCWNRSRWSGTEISLHKE